MLIKKQLHEILITIVLTIALVSCQPISIEPQSVEGGDIQDILVKAAEPKRTTVKIEPFPLPNCDGSEKLTQSLGTLATVSKSATVSNKGTVIGGGEFSVPEAAKLKLEIQVENAYQQTFESAISRVDTIQMSAAAGTHIVYTIVWEEFTFNSIVQYSSDGKVYEVPYTYVLSAPKIENSDNIICDNSTNTEVPQATSISSTAEESYDGWVICWHGRDGYEYLIAYPESDAKQGISLDYKLTNAQGRQLELANDSLKMCYANGEWYGYPDPNPWFPNVSYIKLLDREILACSTSPNCQGSQYKLLPENYFPSNAPELKAPTEIGVHVVSYKASK